MFDPKPLAARLRLAVAASLIGLAGCASDPGVTKRSLDTLPEDSSVRLLRKLSVRQATETAGRGENSYFDKFLAPSIVSPIQSFKASGKVEELPGLVRDSQWWCDDVTRGRNLLEETKEAFADLCRKRGGEPSGEFCRNPERHDEVLFFARVLRTGQEGTLSCRHIEAGVMEPTGSKSDPNYLAALRKVGYKTDEEARIADEAVKARAMAKVRAAAEAAAVERARFEKELPAMQVRGARICLEDQASRVTYRGFVEDTNAGKLKISVVDAFLTRVPTARPGGFQPQVLWDYPDRWRLC